MSARRLTVAVSLLLATLTLTFTTGAGANAATPVPELPDYPGARLTRIGNDLVIGGDYYRLAYFLTPDPLVKVAQHFKSELAKQGHPVTVDGDARSELVVSAFHTRQGLQRSVVLRKHGEKTLGFCVLKDLWARPPSSASAAESKLPPLEGALYAQELRARDGEDSLHRTALVSSGMEEARKALLARFEKAGFKVVREWREEASSRWLVEHSRRGELVLSTLVSIDERTSAVTQSWVGEGGKAP